MSAGIVGSAKYQRRRPGVDYTPSKVAIDTCKAPKCEDHGTILIDGHCAVCIHEMKKRAPSWWSFPNFIPKSKK